MQVLFRNLQVSLSHLTNPLISQNNIYNTSFLGKGVANPTAMLLTTLNLLGHLGLRQEEELLRNAINRVLSDAKVRTRDLGGYSTTNQFTNAVINSL